MRWMEAWVTQMNFPVVNVEWTEAGKIILTQQRFLSSGEHEDEDEAPFGYTWDIPITMATSINMDFNQTGRNITWFPKSAMQVEIHNTDIPTPPSDINNSTWLLLNVQQYGYYRVNYHPNNWKNLIQQLKTDPSVITPINRAQIINDAWSLAKANLLGMDIALQTLQVLKNDGDYVPWRAMSGELSYLDLMLNRAAVYGSFQDYIVQLVNKTYDSVGISSNYSDAPINIFQQQRIVSYACSYGLEKCKQDARAEFGDWKMNPTANKLDVDMRRLILCNGVRYGNKDDWQFVLGVYNETQPGSEQSDLRYALSCTREPWLLHRLMDLTLDPTVILAQDVRSVLEAVSSNPVGADLAYQFLKQHFDLLPAFMTTGSFGRMVMALTNHFNTQQQLDEVKLFIAQNDVSIAETSFRQVVERTTVNMQWMTQNYNVVKEFLEDSNNW